MVFITMNIGKMRTRTVSIISYKFGKGFSEFFIHVKVGLLNINSWPEPF